jgi:hypothetical protein
MGNVIDFEEFKEKKRKNRENEEHWKCLEKLMNVCEAYQDEMPKEPYFRKASYEELDLFRKASYEELNLLGDLYLRDGSNCKSSPSCDEEPDDEFYYEVCHESCFTHVGGDDLDLLRNASNKELMRLSQKLYFLYVDEDEETVSE